MARRGGPTAIPLALRKDDRRAIDGVIFDRLESFVRLVERECGRLGLYVDRGGDFEKISGIGALTAILANFAGPGSVRWTLSKPPMKMIERPNR